MEQWGLRFAQYVERYDHTKVQMATARLVQTLSSVMHSYLYETPLSYMNPDGRVFYSLLKHFMERRLVWL